MFKIKTALQLLFVTTTSLTSLVACGPIEEPKKNGDTFTVQGNYDINKVSLECTDFEKCTNSVGVIMTISTKMEYEYGYQAPVTTISRCTGSLYSPTQVLTAGHCTESIGKEGRTYFRTVATPGRPSQTFEVSRVTHSYYDKENPYSADFAGLELKQPAYGYDYVRAPIEISTALKDVTALVVNQPGSNDQVFHLDAVACEVDTVSKPMHVAEFPSVWGTKSCTLVVGNSGGPIFANGKLTEVLGVLSKSTEVKSGASASNSFFYSPPAPKLNLALFANAACFELPGWPAASPQCLTLNKDSVKKIAKERLLSTLTKFVAEISRRYQNSADALDKIGGATVRMTLEPISVVQHSYTGDKFGIALLPRPSCIVSGELSDDAEILLNAKTYELNTATTPAALQEAGFPITAYGTAILSATGKWKMIYNFSSPTTFQYRPVPEVAKQLATDGVEFELNSCQ